jgi:2',3'-cyclic-nucleotide 2'-phosphodiesterase
MDCRRVGTVDSPGGAPIPTQPFEHVHIRILFLGDIVGEPGRKAVIEQLPLLKQEELDFIIVNGENAAGGKGITPKIAIDLLRAGAAVITTGDHVWDQQEIVDYFPTEPRLLRPLNYPEGTPGNGSVVLETAKGRVAVMQVQGRSFIQPPLENPYLAAENEAGRLRADGIGVIVVDFHAETTSEKIAMGRCWMARSPPCSAPTPTCRPPTKRSFPAAPAISPMPACAARRNPSSAATSNPSSGVSNPACPPVSRSPRVPVRLCGAIIEIDIETGTCLAIRPIPR